MFEEKKDDKEKESCPNCKVSEDTLRILREKAKEKNNKDKTNNQ